MTLSYNNCFARSRLTFKEEILSYLNSYNKIKDLCPTQKINIVMEIILTLKWSNKLLITKAENISCRILKMN
jgi:hypothetical protein